MNDDYTLLNAPPIPGLRFRPPAGPDDAGGLVAVLLGSAARDGYDPLSSVEYIPTHDEAAATLRNSDAGRVILAEIDGRLVGYNRFWEWSELDGMHVWLIVGAVLPEWRGRGLGTALLHWAERRVRQLAVERPGRWEFAGNASSTENDAAALLRDNGYAPGYTVLEMGLDWAAFVPGSTAPDGIDIRAGRVGDAAAVAAAVDESYRDEYPAGRFGVLFDPVDYAKELAGPEHDPALWRVAWDGDEVVGQVIPRLARGRAEIYEVSVRPGRRRQGVARALLSAALLGLRERGVAVVRLHTVREFPTRAWQLYESLGFRTLKEFPRYRKEGSETERLKD